MMGYNFQLRAIQVVLIRFLLTRLEIIIKPLELQRKGFYHISDELSGIDWDNPDNR
jgi:hypothetical protein